MILGRKLRHEKNQAGKITPLMSALEKQLFFLASNQKK